MTITIFGNPILRTKGRRIKEATPELAALADEMIETMREAKGVGLAAQQIGRAIQLCIIDTSALDPDAAGEIEIDGVPARLDELMPLALLNPDIEPLTKERDVYLEGCLSFPEITGEIHRPTAIRVSAMRIDGRPIKFVARGFVARVIQHEHDHLHGVLFIDRMSAAERAALSGRLKRLKKTGEAQAAAEKSGR